MAIQNAIAEKARRDGYARGLQGLWSNPANYMTNDIYRRAYEAGYDIGRSARLQERMEMDE